MSVRAKMRCEAKSGDEASGYSILLRPVAGGSPENDEFYRWTPAGELSLTTVNPGAAAEFEEGREYYVDLTPAG